MFLSRSLVYSHFRRVEEVAKKKGVSMAQIAVAWTLAKDGVSAPIVGTTSLSNLEDIISTWLAFSPRLRSHSYISCTQRQLVLL